MSSVVSAVVLLHEHDNVLIARRAISSGEDVQIDGTSVTIQRDIEVGHKISRQYLNSGDKVIRFGAPIGSMTAPVGPGAHVHTHNMKSDYIASHHRNAVALDGDA